MKSTRKQHRKQQKNMGQGRIAIMRYEPEQCIAAVAGCS
jgi:hypothetical protein